MQAGERLVSDLTVLLLTVTSVGLVLRGRHRLSRAFLAYLMAMVVGNRLVTWWPSTFLNYGFYMGRTATYTALSILAAVEIALLTFSMFPVARRRALLMMALVLVATYGAAFGIDPSSELYPWMHAVGLLSSGGQAGRLWLFVVPVLVAAYHRVPLHPYHRALLVGFALYLGGYSCMLGFMANHVALAGNTFTHPAYLAAHAYLRSLEPVAFAATVGVWTWAAWRVPRPAHDVAPAVRALQPWAVTW